MSELDPHHLMVEAKNGDARAFDALYRLYFTPVFRYLYARTWQTELSEDLAQTTFVKALTGIAGWKPLGKQPLAYFFTIARNTLLDYLRASRETATEDAELERRAGSTPGHEVIVDRLLIGDELKALLRELPEDQRDVLTMRYFGELEYDEIAESLGKNEAAVRQLHSRALKKLRGKNL